MSSQFNGFSTNFEVDNFKVFKCLHFWSYLYNCILIRCNHGQIVLFKWDYLVNLCFGVFKSLIHALLSSHKSAWMQKFGLHADKAWLHHADCRGARTECRPGKYTFSFTVSLWLTVKPAMYTFLWYCQNNENIFFKSDNLHQCAFEHCARVKGWFPQKV